MHYLNGQNIGSCHLMLQKMSSCMHIGSAPYVGNYCLNETQLELLETLIYKLIQSLNFMLTHTVTKEAYFVLGFVSQSFECKDPDVILLSYGDLLTYLIIKNQKNPM